MLAPVGPGLYSSCSQVCHLKFSFDHLRNVCTVNDAMNMNLHPLEYQYHIVLYLGEYPDSIELHWYYAALQVNQNESNTEEESETKYACVQEKPPLEFCTWPPVTLYRSTKRYSPKSCGNGARMGWSMLGPFLNWLLMSLLVTVTKVQLQKM